MRSRPLTALARLRTRAGRAAPPREALIARHVTGGASFVDVGCMWSVDGALCFAAEEAGAGAVTGVDVMGPSPRYEAEHARRSSRVRFVQGDLHEPATVEAAGVHDVVWCSGVLYHAPHPLLTLERLRSLTGRTLLLATETLPETPWRRRQVVFAPTRADHPNAPVRFDAAEGYAAWWWGVTPSALRSLVEAAGFAVQEEHRRPLHVTLVLVAQPVAGGGGPPRSA